MVWAINLGGGLGGGGGGGGGALFRGRGDSVVCGGGVRRCGSHLVGVC